MAARVHTKTKVRGRRGRQRSQKRDTVHETPEVKDMLSGNVSAALAAPGSEDAVASDSEAVEVERVGKLRELRDLHKLIFIDMQTVEGMTTGSRAQLQCRAILVARRIELEV